MSPKLLLDYYQYLKCSSIITRKKQLPRSKMAFVGFDGKKQLRLSMERQWKMKVNFLRRNNTLSPLEWARAGQLVIDDVCRSTNFDVNENDLRLVCMFREG